MKFDIYLNTRPIWLTSYIISGLLLVSFFIEGLTRYYYTTAETILSISLFISFIALLSEWFKAYKIKRSKQFGLALLLTAVFCVYCSIVITFYISTISI